MNLKDFYVFYVFSAVEKSFIIFTAYVFLLLLQGIECYTCHILGSWESLNDMLKIFYTIIKSSCSLPFTTVIVALPCNEVLKELNPKTFVRVCRTLSSNLEEELLLILKANTRNNSK